MKITTIEELKIWQDSLPLTKTIYVFTNKPIFSKDFALRDQIRRAIISVSSNIAEGFEKSNNNEFIRFLSIAKGSLGEVRSQIQVARLLDYITEKELNDLLQKLELLSRQIGAFMNYLKKYRMSNSLTRNP